MIFNYPCHIRGEVNISQYQLESFLQTAEALQIKGLADKPNHRKYMASLVPKMSTSEDTESQSKGPPRLHRTKSNSKKATKKELSEEENQVEPSQDEDCDMDMDHTNQLLALHDNSDQESTKVYNFYFIMYHFVTVY